jgi:hypothetical protein
MSHCSHDLVHTILAYLDDLTTRSKKKHLEDLHTIFLRCHKYNIHLKPIKCVFYVPIYWLFEFTVSKDDISVDPLKVQAFTELPPPHNLHQFYSLQGKSNFLHWFVPDFATIAHDFIQFLWYDIPFVWDD